MQKLIRYLLLMFLFLLPWQTRYIWHYGELNNGYWEYGTFSIYATEILLWVILILFFVQHLLNKEFWVSLKEKKRRASLILILFLLSLFIATALSKNFWVSYNYVFHLLEGMALMVVLVWQGQNVIPSEAVADEGSLSVIPRLGGEGLKARGGLANLDQANPPLPRPSGELTNRNGGLTIALWLGAVVQGALAISQFLTQNVWVSKWLGMAGQEAGNLGPSVIEFADQRWLRAYGSFGSPNSLGIYLAVLFVLGLVLYLKAESWRNKILLSVGQLFILSGLLASFSRGAWLAATVGAVSVFTVLILKHKQFIRSFIKQTSFALALVIFWLVIFYPVFTARFNFDNRLEVRSINERKNQYVEALSSIKSSPVLGVGPGAYTYALYKKYPISPSWQYQPIHNIYLLALVEIGLVGVIFLFFLFKRLFWLMIKNNLIYLPVAVSLLTAGVFDHWLWSMYAGILLWWTVFGLGSKPLTFS